MAHSMKSVDSENSTGTVLHVTSFDSIYRDAKELKRIEEPTIPSHESVSSPILLPRDLPLSDASDWAWDVRSAQEQWSKRMVRMRNLFNRNRWGTSSEQRRYALMKEKYLTIATHMKMKVHRKSMEWSPPVSRDRESVDSLFQRRFSLSQEEYVVVRFPCRVGRTLGVVEVTTNHIGFHGRNGNVWLVENAKIEGVGQLDASSLRISCSDRSFCCEDVHSPPVLLSLLKSILAMREPSMSPSLSANETCVRAVEK
ncbi:hypothetical protein WA538_004756, partial [Blastocystis sp. DL]